MQYGFKYISLNPSASYRGLHDSLVNYGDNDPLMMICNHEKIAVQMAHGYAKVTGEPMIAIVHNVVGLLHASLAIYHAYIDRAPVFIMGATGPTDKVIRRPFIDWIHTAAVQGNAVRNSTKWDYQPGSVHGIPDPFARSIMLITVPLMIPAVAGFDVDLIWFGIITIIPVEIGLLTPPLGLAYFVIQRNLQDERIRIENVFLGGRAVCGHNAACPSSHRRGLGNCDGSCLTYKQIRGSQL